jgi:hypothetical protein
LTTHIPYARNLASKQQRLFSRLAQMGGSKYVAGIHHRFSGPKFLISAGTLLPSVHNHLCSLELVCKEKELRLANSVPESRRLGVAIEGSRYSR